MYKIVLLFWSREFKLVLIHKITKNLNEDVCLKSCLFKRVILNLFVQSLNFYGKALKCPIFSNTGCIKLDFLRGFFIVIYISNTKTAFYIKVIAVYIYQPSSPLVTHGQLLVSVEEETIIFGHHFDVTLNIVLRCKEFIASFHSTLTYHFIPKNVSK